MTSIGILISGRGSNMTAIIDAVQNGSIADARVALVISDKPDAAGLDAARERGVETAVIERRGRTREEHDGEIADLLRSRNVDLICLAGFMRLLSPEFIAAFRGRIINIHPSLLPAFKGVDAQRQALDAGVKVTGCTVHYVDEHLDNGDIIAQLEVDVLPSDTVETLSERILTEEHRLYVETLRQLVSKLA